MKPIAVAISLCLLASTAFSRPRSLSVDCRFVQGLIVVSIEDAAGHRTYVRTDRALHVLGPISTYLLSEEALARGSRGSGHLDLELARRDLATISVVALECTDARRVAAALRVAIAVSEAVTPSVEPEATS